MKTKLFRRSPEALFCPVGTDIVVLSVQRGQCYGMEKVTARVWDLLADPINIDGICDQLLELYDVEPEVCRADVETLIGQFRNEGLVEEVNAAP